MKKNSLHFPGYQGIWTCQKGSHRQFVDVGGLMSYAVNFYDQCRRANSENCEKQGVSNHVCGNHDGMSKTRP